MNTAYYLNKAEQLIERFFDEQNEDFIDQAIDVIGLGLKDHPNDLELLLYAGEICQDIERNKEALNYFKKALLLISPLNDKEKYSLINSKIITLSSEV